MLGALLLTFLIGDLTLFVSTLLLIFATSGDEEGELAGAGGEAGGEDMVLG